MFFSAIIRHGKIVEVMKENNRVKLISNQFGDLFEVEVNNWANQIFKLDNCFE